MSILQSLDQYKHDNVYFCDSIKNNVMANGYFIRILYCMANCTMNGIYLKMDFREVNYEKYYQKYKCHFDIDVCMEITNHVNEIEQQLLAKISRIINGKTPQYKLAEQLKYGFIKLFCENPPPKYPADELFILKISGIWETDTNYGLTYKFSRTSCIE